MNIEETLEKIGLTLTESKVYLALLKIQETQTGKLCNYANIPSSKIYKILDSLMKKGLVNYKVKNNIKIFMPSSPEILNELFKEKQKKLEEEGEKIIKIISQLKKEGVKKGVKEEDYSNYRYYEGITGVKSMWNEFMNDKNGKIAKVYTGKRESYERMLGYYGEIHKMRIKKKIKARIIFSIEDKRHGLTRRKLPLTEIRFIELNNLSEWGVFGDSLFLMYITEKVPRAFLIKDSIFSKTHEQVFDQLWEIAKNQI
ncbi:helix-turn-helix domain-containing protein [Candidatus Woesearchaeota archaeon]|nr:helix-turn-helix domain-containing protein [Candidatus Woesearchaeota archaeon]